ncbi:nucleoside phosphorylase domain-containing protein [Tricladium varicosporioides]|nr:nucleoside phosphorylase domain-containing protein [Hymenoscyphus varicosporioides]
MESVRAIPTLKFEDYIVVWIAPLEIEAQAACYMLDNRHPGRFTTRPGGEYIYIPGDIDGCNVVIATFPAGHDYGVGAAAALASQVKNTFPNICFGLLVGIAAGLPNPSRHPPRDIRLGDVLVGLGKGESAGLISYGFGGETSEGFELSRRGAQAKTEKIVSSAIGNIKLLAPSEGNLFLDHYENMKHREHSNGTFQDPGQEKDELFQIVSEDGVETARLVQRTRRENASRTKVWYGSIGSGDKLMKNAVERDRLRDTFDLIGLEMEAAGTISSIPVGVIRGVCDYADAQKNDDWQPYAAAMAAAYAKEVICRINLHDHRVNSLVVQNLTVGVAQNAATPRNGTQISFFHNPVGLGFCNFSLPYDYVSSIIYLSF